jgi:hypothetical protein
MIEIHRSLAYEDVGHTTRLTTTFLVAAITTTKV